MPAQEFTTTKVDEGWVQRLTGCKDTLVQPIRLNGEKSKNQSD